MARQQQQTTTTPAETALKPTGPPQPAPQAPKEGSHSKPNPFGNAKPREELAPKPATFPVTQTPQNPENAPRKESDGKLGEKRAIIATSNPDNRRDFNKDFRSERYNRKEFDVPPPQNKEDRNEQPDVRDRNQDRYAKPYGRGGGGGGSHYSRGGYRDYEEGERGYGQGGRTRQDQDHGEEGYDQYYRSFKNQYEGDDYEDNDREYNDDEDEDRYRSKNYVLEYHRKDEGQAPNPSKREIGGFGERSEYRGNRRGGDYRNNNRGGGRGRGYGGKY